MNHNNRSINSQDLKPLDGIKLPHATCMSSENILNKLKQAVGIYPDFPKQGVIFRDFFPLFRDPELFEDLLNVLEKYVKTHIPDLDIIAGVESRGFLFGPALALKLKVPFIPIRKPGKLPGKVQKESYALEYGTDSLEVQIDSLKPGQKVVIVDDLIATGGSMEASVKLIRRIGGVVNHCLAVMELIDLKGREKIPASVYSVLQY
ncbi:adenine phosphoribosyltransferase [Caerostris darwini]|uniref:Adenine phosphoribosyltransferase n=1 Tax=Caerostris darwini TaxID=1538125 RepID=A0AAV4R5I1_9ARAC|nr:adenine phosphoribosyltransferase [Caerostris darwini]